MTLKSLIKAVKHSAGNGWKEADRMLRLTVGIEDYIQINDNIRIVFLGGSQKNMRVMIDAPKEVNIARGKALKKRTGILEEQR